MACHWRMLFPASILLPIEYENILSKNVLLSYKNINERVCIFLDVWINIQILFFVIL